MLLLIVVVALAALHSTTGYVPLNIRPAFSGRSTAALKASNEERDDLMKEAKFQTFDMESKRVPDGYLNQDIKNMAGEQKSRVFAYIGLALLPCLFLVPFFLSRDFTPPTID
jgi:hypothetical protein